MPRMMDDCQSTNYGLRINQKHGDAWGVGLAEEKPEDDALRRVAEPEHLDPPVRGKRIAFVWSILAAAGLWVLIGIVAYLIYTAL